MGPLPAALAAATLAAAALASAAGPAGAADMLLLQQTPAPGEEGAVDVLIDRARVSLVRIERRDDDGQEHRVEVTLAPEDDPVLRLRCADLAAARQALDALRPGSGLASLDVTGRCRF
jgi:hypothetical protein